MRQHIGRSIQKYKLGFTLVEVMVVVAIIGLLAAIAVPNFLRSRKNANASACVNNLRAIDHAVQQWAIENKKAGTDIVPDPLMTSDIPGYLKSAWSVCPTNDRPYPGGFQVSSDPICPNRRDYPNDPEFSGHILPPPSR